MPEGNLFFFFWQVRLEKKVMYIYFLEQILWLVYDLTQKGKQS